MWAYVTLFGWSFLAATVVPLGSEAAVAVLVHQGYSISGVVAVATLGNYLGACTTYGIGRAAARALRHRSREASDHRATRLIARYGAPALLLSWVPIIGDAIVAAAGVAQIPFVPFSLWTALGKLVRYLAVAWGAAAW
jgi:membrane protein YqaA with SNARE-associated domain